MSMLYVTADRIGGWEGGASVTFHESDFLKSLAKEKTRSCRVLGREQLENIQVEEQDPWCWDERAYRSILSEATSSGRYALAHFYAGTFTKTIEVLKSVGTKISVMAAAHSIELSRKAHESVGLSFDIPHLTEPSLWKKYLEGYKLADALIVPSRHSESVMREFGCTNPIHVIEHGCEIPETTKPIPPTFDLGYLGSWNCDKSVQVLLQAWKKLSYKDSVLYLGGRDSVSPWSTHLINSFGGGNIVRLGWLKNISDFYNRISCYVQPSTTEGFGLEILESMSFGRLSIASTGAGAVDISLEKFESGNVNDLAEKIDFYKKNRDKLESLSAQSREVSKNYSWDKIGERYKSVWKFLL